MISEVDLNGSRHNNRARYLVVSIGLFLLCAISLCRCSSRYRLDLIIQFEERQDKVATESTQIIRDAELADPYAIDKVRRGTRSVALVDFGGRWPQSKKAGLKVLNLDEFLKGRLYLQLPHSPQADSASMGHRAFVLLFGRYEWSEAEKVFPVEDGFYRVDSLSRGNMYLTISGQFRNETGLPLSLEGQFRISTDY